MATQPHDNQPTIVLVHGAWADATGFDPEIRALRERGFTTIGFGNPLRDLAGDATYLAEFLRTLTGYRARRPLLRRQCHLDGCDRQRSDQGARLPHGWMCDEGESQQELLERFEGSLVGPSIRPCRSPGPMEARASTSTSTARRSAKPSPPTSTRRRPR